MLRTKRAVAVGLILGLVLMAATWTWTVRHYERGRPRASAFETFVDEVMSAPLQVTVRTERGRADADLVFDTFRSVDARMSEWKPTSPLSAVNRSAGRPEAVLVPQDLRAVVRRGMEIGALTDGAFDITWAALWGLWDFKAAEPRVPPEDEIRRRVERVDFRAVEIDDAAGTIRLPREGMLIGLGGIAKGYALDQAAAALRTAGARDFLLSAGGQVYAAGANETRPWRIGIRDPRGTSDDYFALVELRDESLSTSGDYERYFIIDGVRYHHILDPRTGHPSRGVWSATVLSADATLADALSTALMILDPQRGLALVERLDGVEALLVDDQGQFHASRGFESRLKLIHPPRTP